MIVVAYFGSQYIKFHVHRGGLRGEIIGVRGEVRNEELHNL
jgi:hypothetical protein